MLLTIDSGVDAKKSFTDVTIRMLLRLFHKDQVRWQLPWPGDWRCGHDPTNDDLPACVYDLNACL